MTDILKLIDNNAVSDYMAHGECYLWEPRLIWLHVISDLITFLAYYSIPIALFYFVYKRRDIPFIKIFILFGVFIIACGTTHLLSIYTIYVPAYWLEGIVKAITAFVSILSAIIFIPLIPEAIALPTLTKALEQKVAERTKELSLTNEHLEASIKDREKLLDDLSVLNGTLEKRVEEETNKRIIHEYMLIQQSKMASMGEMIGLIAHQWKQPLNAMCYLPN